MYLAFLYLIKLFKGNKRITLRFSIKMETLKFHNKHDCIHSTVFQAFQLSVNYFFFVFSSFQFLFFGGG